MSHTVASPADEITEPRRYRVFAIYSGRYEAGRQAPVYEDSGGFTAKPVVPHAPDFFLDLIAGGMVTTSNVSVYVRVYADGTATYLGPANRFRRMPQRAVNQWNTHAARYGLPVIRSASPSSNTESGESE